jgi:putative endonuclease
MSRAKGQAYEEMATQYLKTQGLKVLERNYHCRLGEIDIIAENKEFLIFVEVKYRKNTAFGEPFAAVDHKKQRRLINTALHYCQQQGLGQRRAMRFDVLSIRPHQDQFDIQWLENAFTAEGF